FTGVIFALELTHDVNSLLPLLIAGVIAHGFTVLVMRRSILTEKVSRRGYHLTREYAIDPLEILFVREVMRTNIVALSNTFSLKDLARSLRRNPEAATQKQRLYPVIDKDRHLRGIVTRSELNTLIEQDQQDGATEHYELSALLKQHPIVAYPDEPLRSVIYRMADTGFTRFPVVESADSPTLVGMVSLNDLLTAMNRNLAEERKRERILRIRTLFPSRSQTTTTIEAPETDPDADVTPVARTTPDTTTTKS
ncbi:MAG TPA: CBS domain-containing protein, partial [Ktedonobacteraceae bacterium]|nr:CBS domain-containing protein [Ktedonobacteraceae bacterium]